MKSTCTIRRGQAAYTMVELMVAVLISVILMVAMYQIFARTQKIFTEGHHRGKMYEEGRAVMDLIVRDLEQIAPSGEEKMAWWFLAYNEEWGCARPTPTPAVPYPEDIDYHRFYGCNFMAWPYTNQVLKVDVPTPVGYVELPTPTHPGWQAAISEPLISSRVEFFTNKDGGAPTSKQWRVMGYRLYSQNNPVIRNTEIIGALWRYESEPVRVSNLNATLPSPLIKKVKDLRDDGDVLYHKLSDNVIHFRMRAVSRDDHPLNDSREKPFFDGDNVPLYVEVELGIIEERLKKEILNDAEVERYDVLIEPLIAAIPNNPAAENLIEGRNVRIMKMLAANTDRILMLRQIVYIKSGMGN